MRAESGKSDAELVRDALDGAKEPLAELVSRHWDTAVSLTGRMLGSQDLARDAAQEAAVAAAPLPVQERISVLTPCCYNLTRK